jgi:ribosomal-protein-alanine N-acetyltransferase
VAATITVRKATAEDLEDLLQLQRQSLPQAAEWSPGALLDGIAGCLAAQQDDRLAGFLLYREIAPGEWEVLNLAVDPALRRQRVASRLIEEFLRLAEGDVFLEVRESNQAARALYAGWGFYEEGLRRGYYHRPVEDAVVMKRAGKNILHANEA